MPPKGNTNTRVHPYKKSTPQTKSSDTSNKHPFEIKDLKCLCNRPVVERVSKQSQEKYLSCGQRTKDQGTGEWGGGCRTFFFEKDWSKIVVCEPHKIVNCETCFTDPLVKEALEMHIQCYCDVPARAAITKKEPKFVFVNCGNKRFKDAEGNWQSRCPFWARVDEWDQCPECDVCHSKMTRKNCWKCENQN